MAGLVVWIYFKETLSISSGLSMSVVQKYPKLKSILLLAGVVLFLALAPSPKGGENATGTVSTILPYFMWVVIGVGIAVVTFLGYRKVYEKWGSVAYFIPMIGVISIMSIVWHLLPKGILGAIDVSFTPIMVIEYITPFILIVPVYFLSYYATEGKRYKNKGYAITVSAIALLMMLFVLHPELLGYVFSPFSKYDFVGKILEGGINSVFLSGLMVFVAFVFFGQGWAASGLFTLFLLFIYLYAVIFVLS